jgi:coenzyme F420-0:L-glutamate ligase/coenzyme F420-1:gamma-L-glutamate ligase
MATKSIYHLSEPRVLEFLTAARVARMATADQAAAPHAIPICFWFDSTRFYFAIDEKPKRATGSGLKRMRNIAQNPRVALIVDHYEEDWSQLAYVLIHGAARVVDDNEEYMLALRHLRDKYRQYRAMRLSPDKNPIVRIEPERVHVWGARFGAPGAGVTGAR